MRRRKRKSRQMKIIVIGSICILSVMTAGYAAFGTSLNISAKGNIVSKGINSETIKKEYCNASSGDGLYKDTTEEGRCVYRGSNPNNYITFNGEETGWRIVSIENDGTLKIMKTDSIGTRKFDDADVRPSDYCNYSGGCNVWGSSSTMLDASGSNVTAMPKQVGGTFYTLPTEEFQMAKYLNNEYYEMLNEDARGQIDNHLWNVGLLALQSNQTLETDVLQERSYKWRGKVGLVSPSDYVKSSTDASCTMVYSSQTSGYPCQNNNYMSQLSLNFWTMVPYSNIMGNGVWVFSEGVLDYSTSRGEPDVLPSLYLKSDIVLSGTGTSDNPYTIKN